MNIAFADETKIRLFNSNIGGNVYVRCQQNERLLKENVVGTIKFGGDGINFFGCVGGGGIGILYKIDGNLTG